MGLHDLLSPECEELLGERGGPVGGLLNPNNVLAAWVRDSRTSQ